jgi:Glycosyltransferase sugar-binding region containing DXD motif
MAIPKKLHLIWIGDESKRPEKLIESWRQMNPSYSVRVWGNQDLLAAQWMTIVQIQAWLTREVNGAADVMRWEILYRHGGVAVDADSRCVRPLEDWLLEPDCFAVWENEIARPGLIACGAMGCVPGHPLIGQIISDIASDQDLTGKMAWEKVGPGRLTDTVRKHRFADITVYPSHYFIPRHFTGIKYAGSGQTFATQEWGSTFNNYGQPGKEPAQQCARSKAGNVYRMTQEASVALAEGKPTQVARLVADVLHLDAGNTQVRRLLDQAIVMEAASSDNASPSPNQQILSRGIGASFFLQRLKMAGSLANRMELIGPLVSGKKVLHVGCVDSPIFNPQDNLHLTLTKLAAELHGMDIDTAGLANLRQHFEGVYFEDVESCLQHGTHYDIVLVPETIEHVENAAAFLQEVDRIPFDSIMITAPCIYGWGQFGVLSYREKDESYGPYGWLLNPGSFIEEVHPDHKYWFSPYTLANLVESCTAWRIQSVQLLQWGRQISVIANHGDRTPLPIAPSRTVLKLEVNPEKVST